ncbi:MAG: prepilin-type N-terminal cleavage/methylation domain-containing protein [Armatimonadetes bacterium]|nr:prepilin-type N-terminal cleavage/methylation domain-containing protein [Armatimonadota bacterium]MBS1711546.1 prepilin-type N-terminal cleavage/methylation domain-containing protein [Armatimonadota bacterium]MBX3109899.1 prepilin-type N-terminal cleavage/methylation domain-containing protein [Fimbriimonadaceae bacterium]
MKSKTGGFTLVEIMIVVLIIGILLAIAVPNFVKARQNSRVQTVVGNLKQIESAKEQWAMDTGAASTATPTSADLTPTYLKKWPVGPVGAGTDYVANDMATLPTFKGKNSDDFQDAATKAAAIAAAGL